MLTLCVDEFTYVCEFDLVHSLGGIEFEICNFPHACVCVCKIYDMRFPKSLYKNTQN